MSEPAAMRDCYGRTHGPMTIRPTLEERSSPSRLIAQRPARGSLEPARCRMRKVGSRMRAVNLTQSLERLGPFEPDAMSLSEARARRDRFYRETGGREHGPDKLLSATGKMAHDVEGVARGINLRAGAASGVEVCSWRSAGCTAACVLETSFHGRDSKVRDARSLKTLFLQAEPQAFVTLVAHELRRLVARHGRVAFRPNIASDLRWEYIAPALFEIAGVRGYDYTKANPLKHRGALENYRLTYSVSEHPISEAIGAAYVAAGGTAAVVVATRKHDTPSTWRGAPAIDGDATDDRTTDPKGCYVILAAKGSVQASQRSGKADASGFVKVLEVTAA